MARVSELPLAVPDDDDVMYIVADDKSRKVPMATLAAYIATKNPPFVPLTQGEYDAITPVPGVLYLITET